MDIKRILGAVDHTLLAPECTWEQIQALCDDALRYQTASVCIPPCFVKQAKEYGKESLTVCTVIGFPNGYNTTAVKVFETENAVADGADEIDMVEEKISMCRLVTEAGADFIKTSTGFSTGGATFEDVSLFAEHVGPGVKIKAAGGIGSMEDAERFLKMGADRLGTSRVVKLVKEMEGTNG